MACTPAPPGTSIADISDLSAISNNDHTMLQSQFPSASAFISHHQKIWRRHPMHRVSSDTYTVWTTDSQLPVDGCETPALEVATKPAATLSNGPTHHRGHQHGAVHAYLTNFEASFEPNPCPSCLPKRPHVFFTYRLVNVAENDKNSKISSATSRRHGVDQPNMSEPLAISITIL